MPSTATKLLTAEEFARLPNPADGSKQELVRGEVITTPAPSFFHGIVQVNIASLMTLHARRHKLGRVAVASGVITNREPDTVRGPDVSYWSFERLPADHVPVVYANVAPDLCVEVLSPGNTPARTTKKVSEYFACGARMVWVIDPDERTVTIYRKPGDGRVLWEDATITGEDVLPNFSCPVSEFFQPA
jgi:Uma2 family endonuclease